MLTQRAIGSVCTGRRRRILAPAPVISRPVLCRYTIVAALSLVGNREILSSFQHSAPCPATATTAATHAHTHTDTDTHTHTFRFSWTKEHSNPLQRTLCYILISLSVHFMIQSEITLASSRFSLDDDGGTPNCRDSFAISTICC